MKSSKTGLGLYRCVYWANQGLLHAVRALQEAEVPVSDLVPGSATLNDNRRRTQAMIEETRDLMNRTLTECIEPKCGSASRPRKRTRVKAWGVAPLRYAPAFGRTERKAQTLLLRQHILTPGQE